MLGNHPAAMRRGLRPTAILLACALGAGANEPSHDEHAASPAVEREAPALAPAETTGHAPAAATPVPREAQEGHDAHDAKDAGHGGKPVADTPEMIALRRAREDADSGRLHGVLPRSTIVWKSKKGKPLRLESDVVVGPGQILEIAAGTQVRVAARDREPLGDRDWADSQFVSLIVQGGTLRVLGTAEKPVRFVPERSGRGPRWGGIRIVDTRTRPQADLSWVELPGALEGIVFDRAAGSVRHAVVVDGNMGLRILGGSAPEIVQSVVARQQVAGLQSEKSGPLVRGCLFVDNAGVGARFDGAGLARLENNDFWNNAGGDLVRPPPAVGGWSSDSVVPDRYGNVRANPVFRASALHAKLWTKLQDSLRDAPIWRRRPPDLPPGSGPWALSPFSPLLDRGSRSPLCRDRDGSACDIGLWGGSD